MGKYRRITAEYAIIYTMGALGYGLLEILWRGYTHWSMTVTGGLCFVILYRLNAQKRHWPFWQKCAAGALAVTLVEFAVGCVVNLGLGWHVWDYSAQPFSLLGQVCLGFALLWLLLCVPIFALAELLRHRLFCYD